MPARLNEGKLTWSNVTACFSACFSGLTYFCRSKETKTYEEVPTPEMEWDGKGPPPPGYSGDIC